MQFTKATRSKSKLRLALCGVSGSGKTTAALMIAKGLGGRTALIDTEAGSASLYSDEFDFDVLELKPPFNPEKFTQAIEAAEAAGYANIIIDSMSHEWDGAGGCLALVEQVAASKFKGNSYAAWSDITPRHQRFLEKIVTSKSHIIATIRMKAEIVQEGRKVFKAGMKYIMRDGFEFEFTTVFELTHENHYVMISKDRTKIFTDVNPFTVSKQTGVDLLNWINSTSYLYLSNDQLIELNNLLNQLDSDMQAKVRGKYPNFADEKATRFDEISAGLTKMVAKAKADELARTLAQKAIIDEQSITDDTHDLEHHNATKVDGFDPLNISA